MKRSLRQRLLSLSLLSGLTLLSATACLRPSEERDYGDPTERNVATEEGGIVAWVVSPTAATNISSASVEFEIAAYAKAGGDALTVRVGTGDAGKVDAAASGKPGPDARFRATVPLVHGANVVQISAENADGSKFRRLSYVVLYEGQPPGLAFHRKVPAPFERRLAQHARQQAEVWSVPILR